MPEVEHCRCFADSENSCRLCFTVPGSSLISPNIRGYLENDPQIRHIELVDRKGPGAARLQVLATSACDRAAVIDKISSLLDPNSSPCFVLS